MSYLVYKDHYARPMPEGGLEEWWQTLQRVTEGTFNIQKIHCRNLGLPWNEPKAQKSAQDMFQRMWAFKFLPPGRGLWAMGTEVVFAKGSAALNNCGFSSSNDIDIDFADPFCFLMDMSMLGVGIGGDTKGAGKVRLQAPRTTMEPHVVDDSREGWVALVRRVLDSFVGKGTYPLSVDYSKVRPKGAPLRGFGGIASGPEPLNDLVEGLTYMLLPPESSVSFGGNWAVSTTAHFKALDQAQPYRIRSSHIVDVFNMIGKCVVAGGIRRSAEIMFGEPDDKEFIALKQDKEKLYSHRWASNNSILAKVGMDYDSVAETIARNGEPGVAWLDNMRAFGRMADPPDWRDRKVMGSNPCVEQSLEDRELCCLVETFPAHHDTLADYKATLKMAYLYAKTVTLIPTHDPRANAVCMRNRRIGCSMSGIQQAKSKFGRREFLRWCDDGFKHVRSLDELYSDWLCVPRSIKVTSVKPSGTVSLLAGATPGIHHAHAEYYIRRKRVQDTSPLLPAIRAAGYKVEPDAYSPGTSVVEFPIHEPNFLKSKDDVTIWEQFCDAADMQRYWADNQVSITVTFKPHEAKDIATCLSNFEDKLKAISLLPLADGDHGYKQPPYEAIDKAAFDAMTAAISPVDFSAAAHGEDERFCSNDTCTVDFSRAKA